MDRLSYKDGYLKGVYQSLNILQQDGIISEKQRKDYKDKLFNNEIIVPEKYQFYNRNYIYELYSLKKKRGYMQKIIPLIKEIERNNIYLDYSYKSVYEMLVDGVGINKSSTSEILLISEYFYRFDGTIKPEWSDFETKTLIFLARCHKKGDKNIFDLRKSHIIRPTMSYAQIKDLFLDPNITLYDLFGMYSGK